MNPIPVYRVVYMEADEPSCLYNYEVTLQPIDEKESEDLATGNIDSEGYERRPKIKVNVTEDVFHSLRVGMIYRIAFTPSNLRNPDARVAWLKEQLAKPDNGLCTEVA